MRFSLYMDDYETEKIFSYCAGFFGRCGFIVLFAGNIRHFTME